MVCINIIILQDHIIASAEHNPNQVSFRYQSDMEVTLLRLMQLTEWFSQTVNLVNTPQPSTLDKLK